MAKLRKSREPTTALINIVFLILVFFMVAGTMAPMLDTDLTLVLTDALDGRAPPDALVLHADGSLTFRGEVVDAADIANEAIVIKRLVPDRNVPALRLVEVARALTEQGAAKVMIVTEQALQ